MEYNVINFCELIQNEGCLFIEEIIVEEDRFHYYLSRNGSRKVCICVTDETMTRTTAKDVSSLLELPDLIERYLS